MLIVDDDVRNLFALTSMLERWQMEVIRAENGRRGLELLQATPDMDVVLMDIMMPGWTATTTRPSASWTQFRSLPIIALTAKAMKDDRQKCLEPAPRITSPSR